ncbi:zinc ribbon domain-containing protein [Candidatus Bathyarchaeota archaeon]|nr:zinc ribbon domain-containing protein [Candidatus Bathyarchaeota archaeon]MBS7628414.1 zinc ribbon domain-containing protein [Candidatus Bathyarchaeota archaeon]
MGQAAPPPDYFKTYIDAGFDTIIWRNPRASEDSFLDEFEMRLESEGLKAQVLKAPEPPPNLPIPPYFPELTLTILNPSSAYNIMNVASKLLREYYLDSKRITVKIDIVSNSRFISGEVSGPPSKVAESIKNISKFGELTSSSLALLVLNMEDYVQPTKICPKCGGVITSGSRFCHICGEKQ